MVPIGVLIDANHDGKINPISPDADETTRAKPFRFWINNDRDGLSSVEGETDVEDDLIPLPEFALNDCDNAVSITCKRDLEDFARLWLYFGARQQAIHDGEILVGLEWKDVTSEDDPQIRLLKAVEPAGGTLYLTDKDTAEEQIAGDNGKFVKDRNSGTLVSKFMPFIFPASFWSNLSENRPNTYFLFEGVKRGKGRLALCFYKSDGTTKIGEATGLYVDLKDIKEMYERWTVGDGNGDAPSQGATISTRALPLGVSAPFQYDSQSPEEKKYIVFVHGWNVPPWEKDAFAETAYKRLYWQGYKGRFAAFQWPTTYGFDSANLLNAVVNHLNYDQGEYSAWRSASGFSSKLTNMNAECPGQVYVLAHSMGNVVMGETLRLMGRAGNQINTYVASQAAIPAQCYDGSIPDNLEFFYDHPSIPNGTQDYGPATPNIYPFWLASGAGGATRKVNFYNQNDYALAAPAWEFDQITKPDIAVLGYAYFYGLGRSENLNIVEEKFFKNFGISINLFLGDVSDVRDRYEIMAFAAEARSHALGASVGVEGFDGQINLQTIWPPDGNQFREHKWHSAQFRFNNMEQNRYWKTLMGQFGLSQQ
jgi:hypothetical protein